MIRRLMLAALAVVVPVIAASAQGPAAPGVTRTGNVSPIVADLDRSLAFYEGVLHLQVPPARGGGPRQFLVNPGLHRMFGTTGSTERHTDARIPGTSMAIEMIEFRDLDRRAARPRIQDPGQVTIVLLVRDVAAVLARAKAAGVPVLTPGGTPVTVREGARAVLLEDPDGRPVELRQPATLPADAPAGEIVGGRLSITTESLERTVAIYRDTLGFDVTAPTRFGLDPFVRTLTGVRGDVRRSVATAPGTGQVFELIEFKDVDRTPLRTRIQDPGSVRLQVMVRGINEVTAGVVRAGGAVMSDGGERAPLPPNLWGIMLRAPDNLYLSLLEPCDGCAPRPPAPAQSSAASPGGNVPPVPALSGPIAGPAKMYPDPVVSVVPGAAQVEDFPYLTEEYFVSGTANEAPYTTRIVVRRPKNPSEGSRTVVAEAMHAGGRSLIFEWSRESILTRRHVFVEIVHSPANVALLKTFNADRYATLSIAQGQATEILAQVGRLMKSGAGPFGPYRVRDVTLMGTSASSGTVRNYFPAHGSRRLPGGGPIYDGFLLTSTNGNEPLPIVDVPVVQMPTQTEVATWAEAGIKYRRADSDEPGNRYRLYEVAGMPHNNSRENPGFLNDPCTLPVTDFPAGAFTALGLNYLVDWIANGRTPPHAPPIEVDQNSANDGSFLALDEFGNAKGGIRNVFVDVPVATHGVMGKGKTTAQDRLCLLAGTKVPLKADALQRLYKGKADYVARVDRRLKQLIDDGWFLPEYAEAVRADARKVAW